MSENLSPKKIEDSIGSEILSLVLFDDKKVTDLIKESLKTTQEIENEARELYTAVKENFLKPANGKQLTLEDAVMLSPVAQDYLKLMSDQVDNRTKLLKTISDLVKAAQPNAQFNQIVTNPQETNYPSLEIQKEIIDSNPLKDRPPTRNEKRQEEQENSEQSPIPVTIIHSYNHKS